MTIVAYGYGVNLGLIGTGTQIVEGVEVMLDDCLEATLEDELDVVMELAEPLDATLDDDLGEVEICD